MLIFHRRKKNAALDTPNDAPRPARSKEEILDLILESRREWMEKLPTEEALLEAIHAEGLDAVVDFKLNTDSAYTGSVRLNRQEDGSYLLFTVGERGIDWQETFRDPREAYYQALLTVRQEGRGK